MLLQETCLTGQLIDERSFGSMAQWQIQRQFLNDGDGGKYVVFIVYNFFEKCLNQSLAATFRAPNRCGLLFN
ncbi:hypothetical protein PFAS1_01605 [Pseudomonas frederiksbergensis]|nr:hypothetical protein PFAS1_01605 [Pseudomonas frederiksbergensis]